MKGENMLKEKKIEKQEKKWAKKKDLIERKQKIKEEKRAIKSKKKSTTKILIFFLFLNCTLIELFTGWATVQSLNIALLTDQAVDFSPLVTLIGTVVGEVVGFAVYAAKASKENSAGGLVYDQIMANYNTQQDYGLAEEEDDKAVG
jgi:F0F1-type ATP synthase assembly protein I